MLVPMLLDFLHRIVYNAGCCRTVICAAVAIALPMPKLLWLALTFTSYRSCPTFLLPSVG